MDEKVISSISFSGRWPRPNPYGRISAIAQKLGIAPVEPGRGTVCMEGDDGNLYDVFEVAERFLDRLAANTP